MKFVDTDVLIDFYRNDGKFVNSPGSNDGFDYTELQNGITYYCSAFTYDEVPLTIPKLTHFSPRSYKLETAHVNETTF